MSHFYSIRTRVTAIFIVVFVLICALFLICLILELKSSHKEQNEYHLSVVNSLMHEDLNDANFTKHLLNQGFIEVKNAKTIRKIKEKGRYYFIQPNEFGLFSSIAFRNTLYLEVLNKDFDKLFKTKRYNVTFEFMVFGFVLSLLLTLALYLSIIKNLKPLERLRMQVLNANKNANFTSEFKNDEIGAIASEFWNTTHKVNELVESRQLFLRTIMHELKTPIGKGRLVAEMMKEKKQKERLIAIFTRLDALINEFAKIESLYSKNYSLNIKPHAVSEILEATKQLLMLENFDKKVRVKNKRQMPLNVDLESFSLVLKNLIDNALKYSIDGLCVVQFSEKSVSVKNKGKPLQQDFESYLVPFVRGENSTLNSSGEFNKSDLKSGLGGTRDGSINFDKNGSGNVSKDDSENLSKNGSSKFSKDGLGLGLYIVSKSCKIHNFKLDYKYKNGVHCFIVNF